MKYESLYAAALAKTALKRQGIKSKIVVLGKFWGVAHYA